MPEVEIRPAVAEDIPQLVAIDHNYTSDYVWQMDFQVEDGQWNVNFRRTRLPRSVRVEYPRSPQLLKDDWESRSGLLVATTNGEVAGYISLTNSLAPVTTWVTDIVVLRRLRRQGIGSTLVLAAQEWARENGKHRMILEMQPKNHAVFCLAEKLGYDLCGYNDRYYANQDIALFFSKSLR